MDAGTVAGLTGRSGKSFSSNSMDTGDGVSYQI